MGVLCANEGVDGVEHFVLIVHVPECAGRSTACRGSGILRRRTQSSNTQQQERAPVMPKWLWGSGRARAGREHVTCTRSAGA